MVYCHLLETSFLSSAMEREAWATWRKTVRMVRMICQINGGTPVCRPPHWKSPDWHCPCRPPRVLPWCLRRINDRGHKKKKTRELPSLPTRLNQEIPVTRSLLTRCSLLRVCFLSLSIALRLGRTKSVAHHIQSIHLHHR